MLPPAVPVASAGRKPWATAALGLVLLASAALGGVSTDFGHLRELGARPPLTLGFHARPENLVLPLLLHFGPMHWGCNFVLALLCGWSLEQRVGSVATWWVFWAAGIGSLLGSLALHPESSAVGCSGAVFGLWAASVAAAWIPRREESRLRQTVLLALALALSSRSPVSGITVDNSGHLCGALVGALAWLTWRPWWARLLFFGLGLAWAAWSCREPRWIDFS